MAKSVASERCRYRAAKRDYCARVNRQLYPGFMRLAPVPYHMRRKFPGWRARVKEWNDNRPSHAERKAKQRKVKFYGRQWQPDYDPWATPEPRA